MKIEQIAGLNRMGWRPFCESARRSTINNSRNMKNPILAIILICQVLFSGGCFTYMASTGITNGQNTNFFPESAWLDPNSGTVALGGYVLGETETCYLIIPQEITNIIRDSENRVLLSQIEHLPFEETKKLKVIRGRIPENYVPMEMLKDPNKSNRYGGAINTNVRNVINPKAVLFLPIAVVIDVVTLPVQVLVLTNLPTIN